MFESSPKRVLTCDLDKLIPAADEDDEDAVTSVSAGGETLITPSSLPSAPDDVDPSALSSSLSILPLFPSSAAISGSVPAISGMFASELLNVFRLFSHSLVQDAGAPGDQQKEQVGSLLFVSL